MTTITTDEHARRETADLRGSDDANKQALERFERLIGSGKLRCDRCHEQATTLVIHRKGQSMNFSGTCATHTTAGHATTATRKLELALAELAIKENK